MNKKTEFALSLSAMFITGVLSYTKFKELKNENDVTKTDFKKTMTIISDITKTFSKNA